MGRSEELAERGLQVVNKYCVVFWDEDHGWYSRLYDTVRQASECGGYGNFTGYSKVECIIPLEAKYEQ